MRELKNKFIEKVFIFYRRYLSVYKMPSCRFMPTCSQYSEEALLKWGIRRGALLTLARILRCQPLCQGGYDPPPARRSEL